MTSSAPKRRLEVHSPHRSGRRRSAHRRGLRRFIPSPALAGVIVLLAAGIGTVAVSPNLDSEAITTHYHSIESSGSLTAAGSVNEGFDSKRTKKQVKAQTKQLQQALAADTAKVQSRADELKQDQWVLPVTGYRITARFGDSSGLWSSNHTGLDLAGPSGSTIVAVASGTVKSTESSGGCGNQTTITLKNGTEMRYCHQSEMTVSEGDKVTAGDVIGYTGSTGNVTGPHLHLEVRPDGGDPVDPEQALSEHNVQP